MSEIGQHVTNQSCTHSDLNIAILGASRTLERNFINLVYGLTQKMKSPPGSHTQLRSHLSLIHSSLTRSQYSLIFLFIWHSKSNLFIFVNLK